MYNKNKLKKIANIIKMNLPLIEAAENPEINSQFTPILYESGLNLLVKKAKLDSVMSKKGKFLNTKMVKSAKNLTSQFEDFGITSYLKSFELSLEKIQKLGGPLNLLPHQDDVINVIKNSITDYHDESFNFYSSILVDLFNVGKTHQEILNNKKLTREAGLKKYTFNLNDVGYFEKLNNFLSEDFKNKLIFLQNNLIKSIKQAYDSELDEVQMIDQLHEVYSKFSFDIENTLRQHAWKSYSAGNLYQLKKDNIQMIAWKTNHQIDDCIHCRALETGELILKTKDGQFLPYKRHIDKVSYYLKDIIQFSEFEGLAYFGHEDCRCFWINAD